MTQSLHNRGSAKHLHRKTGMVSVQSLSSLRSRPIARHKYTGCLSPCAQKPFREDRAIHFPAIFCAANLARRMQYVLSLSVSHCFSSCQISYGSQWSQSPPPSHSQSVQQNAASQPSQLSLVWQSSHGHFSSLCFYPPPLHFGWTYVVVSASFACPLFPTSFTVKTKPGCPERCTAL